MTQGKIIFTIILLIIIFTLTGCFNKKKNEDDSSKQYTDEDLSVRSPDQKILVQFNLNQNGSPTYSILYNNISIIESSKFGFKFKDNDALDNNFKILGIETKKENNTWYPVWGEKSRIINHYQELIIHLKEDRDEEARKMDLVFRVFNDGVGFRYISRVL